MVLGVFSWFLVALGGSWLFFVFVVVLCAFFFMFLGGSWWFFVVLGVSYTNGVLKVSI